jgi:uncharacterized protein YpbB
MRTTYTEQLQSKARHTVGSTVQIYNIFDGWRSGQIIKLGWDHMFGRVQYFVTINGQSNLTHEKYMRACQ